MKLAHEIAESDPCYICQGLGPQRHTNGDNAARAIMVLPQLVGQVGKPGTTSGGTIGNDDIGLNSLPTGDNPIKTKFPNFLWPEAIRDGAKLTATNAGIQNAEGLKTGIKFLVNYGNNMMANQNADINSPPTSCATRACANSSCSTTLRGPPRATGPTSCCPTSPRRKRTA